MVIKTPGWLWFGFDHVFKKDKKRAAQEWLVSFLKRNPDISLRTPEPTFAARAQVFNRPQVSRYFEPAYARLSLVENENLTPTQTDLKNTNVSTLDPLETQNTTTQMNAIPEDEERPLTTDVGVFFSEELVTNAQESLTAESSITTHDDGVEPGSSKSLEFPIAILSLAPQGQFIRGQGKRKFNPAKGHWLLTSTPNMKKVIEKNRPKDPPAKKKRQMKKMFFEDGKSNGNKKSTVKSTVVEAPKKRQIPKRQRQTAQTIDSSSDTEDIAAENEDDEDCPCIYCNDLHSRSKPGESWLRCMSCFRFILAKLSSSRLRDSVLASVKYNKPNLPK